MVLPPLGSASDWLIPQRQFTGLGNGVGVWPCRLGELLWVKQGLWWPQVNAVYPGVCALACPVHAGCSLQGLGVTSRSAMGASPEGEEWGGVPGATWLSPEPCRHWSPSGLIEAQVSGDQVLVSVCGAYRPQLAPGTFSCLFLRLPEPWPTPALPGLRVPVTRRGRGPSPLSSSYFDYVCNKEQLKFRQVPVLERKGQRGPGMGAPVLASTPGPGLLLGLSLEGDSGGHQGSSP